LVVILSILNLVGVTLTTSSFGANRPSKVALKSGILPDTGWLPIQAVCQKAGFSKLGPFAGSPGKAASRFPKGTLFLKKVFYHT
jgi:hypothetical protein